jgi:hypothetical protein
MWNTARQSPLCLWKSELSVTISFNNSKVAVSYEVFCINIAKDFILLGNKAAAAGNLIPILRQCIVLI